ncbi:MAG: hypothetical protein ACLVJH_04580 [Faecalibacterium prausnitzii]
MSSSTNDLTQYTHAVRPISAIAERYYRPASHGHEKAHHHGGGGCPRGRDPA